MFNKWEIIKRKHKRYPYKRFNVHALVNIEGDMFGYIIEELEENQENYTTYEGDASFAMAYGAPSETLAEAQDKLRDTASKAEKIK